MKGHGGQVQREASTPQTLSRQKLVSLIWQEMETEQLQHPARAPLPHRSGFPTGTTLPALLSFPNGMSPRPRP